MIERKSFAQAFYEFKISTDALVSEGMRNGRDLLPALERAAKSFRELRRALYRAERAAKNINAGR
jgi:hypothetical protein